jgi:hypothetical protein
MNKNRWPKEKVKELNREWEKFRRKLKKKHIDPKVIPLVNKRKPLSKGKFARKMKTSMKEAIEIQKKEKADYLKRQALKNS